MPDIRLTEELLCESGFGEEVARKLLGDLAYQSEDLKEKLAEVGILLATEKRSGVRQQIEIALSSLKRVFGLRETLASTPVGDRDMDMSRDVSQASLEVGGDTGQTLERAGHIENDAPVGHADGHQELVLVRNVELMEQPKRIVSSLVRFGLLDEVHSRLRRSLYLSRRTGFESIGEVGFALVALPEFSIQSLEVR